MGRVTPKIVLKQRQASANSKIYSKQLRQTQKIATKIKSGQLDIKDLQGLESGTIQFKLREQRMQPRLRIYSSQFKSLEPGSAVTQFKPLGPKRPVKQFRSPGLRVQSKPKGSPRQFKSPGSIRGSNLSMSPAQAISSTLIAKPEQSQTISGQLTQPLPLKDLLQPQPHVELPVKEATESRSTGIDKRLVWIMAVAYGLLIANFIYLQPLLAQMGQSFAVPANEIGWVATLPQLGYTLALIFIVPLGAKYNPRRLIVLLVGAVAVALVEMATAPTVPLLIIGSCAVGLAGVAPELIVPLITSMATPRERGRVIGTLLFGMFITTPLAAVLSGFVGQYLGWRAMYWIAAGLMIALVIVLHLVLPKGHPTKRKISYLGLLGSLWKLLRSEPVLQETSILAVLVYGSFTAFWVTLSFVLETAPYHYGSQIAGLFGLVGIAGALAVLFVGEFVDSLHMRLINGIVLIIVLLAFVVMWIAGQWLIGLIIGALLLDVGAQTHEVANETRICILDSSSSIPLYTVYMFFYCVGGSLGPALGTFSWSLAGRNGMYGMACLMLIVAIGFYVLHSKRIQRRRQCLNQ